MGGYASGIDLSLEEVLFLALFSDVLQPVFGGIVSVVFSDDGNSVRIYFLHFVLAVCLYLRCYISVSHSYTSRINCFFHILS